MNRVERRQSKRQLNLLGEIVKIMHQYFPKLVDMFEGLTDIRNQSYVKYKMKVIFMVRLLSLMSSIKSMHKMERMVATDEALENVRKICGLELENIPHCDTINDVFVNVKVEEFEKIITYIVRQLIRSKMFDKYRIRGRYFLVVFDGT
ncbi:MAG: transposase family protein [Clostridia bacterium]|nr:transposase family protein [Clostridia bacterium]